MAKAKQQPVEEVEMSDEVSGDVTTRRVTWETVCAVLAYHGLDVPTRPASRNKDGEEQKQPVKYIVTGTGMVTDDGEVYIVKGGKKARVVTV